ncbi:hypothetical protein B0T16DRAFT_448403 [Cercophora newfieldiana]|uniref:Uncharacterized protein n=1 Tax=Cercophora newfieldiana TaxID=92897 RepID=A0AA39XV13_9PEZI|nr:hypothetical protein B0T16DRAFT_448403 [Cercophora newfieldiana]
MDNSTRQKLSDMALAMGSLSTYFEGARDHADLESLFRGMRKIFDGTQGCLEEIDQYIARRQPADAALDEMRQGLVQRKAAVEQKLAQLNAAVGLAEQARQDHVTQTTRLAQATSVADSRTTAINKKAGKLEIERKALDSYRNELDVAEENIAEERAKLETTRRYIATQKPKLDERADKIEEARQENGSMRERLVAFETDLNRQKRDLEERQEEVERVERSLEERRAQAADRDLELARREAWAAALEDQTRTLKAEMAEEATRLAAQRVAVANEAKELEGQRSKLLSDMNDERRKLDARDDNLARLDGIATKMEALVEPAQHALTGAHNTWDNYITVVAPTNLGTMTNDIAKIVLGLEERLQGHLSKEVDRCVAKAVTAQGDSGEAAQLREQLEQTRLENQRLGGGLVGAQDRLRALEANAVDSVPLCQDHEFLSYAEEIAEKIRSLPCQRVNQLSSRGLYRDLANIFYGTESTKRWEEFTRAVTTDERYCVKNIAERGHDAAHLRPGESCNHQPKGTKCVKVIRRARGETFIYEFSL